MHKLASPPSCNDNGGVNTVGAGRYAPSPSGDLHVGNLRTALLAWLFARSTDRQFRMRVEDVDRGRDAGAAQQQLEDLSAIGVTWDGEVVYQTHRRAAHEAAIETLRSRDLVYECVCTRREIQEAPSAPHAPPGAYPGTCRDRTQQEAAAARATILPRRPALRLRVAEGQGEQTFRDELCGELSGHVDDFVLQRGDGAIAYNLAVVVDDAAMGVDQVVRGNDLLSSTPRQVLLQQLLGYATPQYAHVPLVLGPSGARLAKRDGAVTLQDLSRLGMSAAQVRSMLAFSLGLADQGEPVEMVDLIERFEPAKLPREPWIFIS
ncbi:MAG: tRNA glutamyl-Q(34) synthetase GluQRS [Leucobacter sp.]|nr:tRNA glutamyl-Q(34) synthetase GluQRS [Leucobacter sp.]